MPGAGTLDRRITLTKQGDVIGHNPLNEPIYGPDIKLTVWARRADVSDGERFAAGQVGSYLMTRFVIRSNPQTRSITPVASLTHDGATYNIYGIKETSEGRRRFIEITAVKDND